MYSIYNVFYPILFSFSAILSTFCHYVLARLSLPRYNITTNYDTRLKQAYGHTAICNTHGGGRVGWGRVVSTVGPAKCASLIHLKPNTFRPKSETAGALARLKWVAMLMTLSIDRRSCR